MKILADQREFELRSALLGVFDAALGDTAYYNEVFVVLIGPESC